jgi:hypothetical protein
MPGGLIGGTGTALSKSVRQIQASTRSEMRGDKTETAVPVLCQLTQSCWSVPAEIADIAETAAQAETQSLLILKGFFERKTGAARQD